MDCCDLITYVPPKSFGYEHLGEPYYMNLGRQVKFNPPPTDIDNHRSQGGKGMYREIRLEIGDEPLRPLADPAPGNYVWTSDSGYSLARDTPGEQLAA